MLWAGIRALNTNAGSWVGAFLTVMGTLLSLAGMFGFACWRHPWGSLEHSRPILLTCPVLRRCRTPCGRYCLASDPSNRTAAVNDRSGEAMVGTVRTFPSLCVDDQGRCRFRGRPGCSDGERRRTGIRSGIGCHDHAGVQPLKQRIGNGLEGTSGTIIEARAKACCDLRFLRALKCLFEFRAVVCPVVERLRLS